MCLFCGHGTSFCFLQCFQKVILYQCSGILEDMAQFLPEAVVQRCSVKKVFSKFRKIYIKTPVPKSLFNKVAGLRYRCFPVNFAKILRTTFFTEHLLVAASEPHAKTVICSDSKNVKHYEKRLLQKILFFRGSRSQMFIRKVFLRIYSNSQETTCTGVSI